MDHQFGMRIQFVGTGSRSTVDGVAAEIRLLVALCRTPLSPASAATASAIIGSPVNWDLFFRLARRWQVEPTVMVNLRALGTGALGPSVVNQAAERERETRSSSLARALGLMELLDSFQGNAIPVLVLKGPAVAIWGYGEVSLRSFGDLDLLVTVSRVGEASALLEKLGYAPDFAESSRTFLTRAGHALEFLGPLGKVELHSGLFPAGFRFRVADTTIWGTPSKLSFANGSMWSPDPAAHYLYVCAHATKHEWASLRFICDVAQLAVRLTDPDAQRVLMLSRESHSLAIVGLAATLIARVFPDVTPRAPQGITTRFTSGLAELALGRLGFAPQRSERVPEFLAKFDPWVGSLLYWALARERIRDGVFVLLNSLRPPQSDTRSARLSQWASRPLLLARKLVRRRRDIVR